MSTPASPTRGTFLERWLPGIAQVVAYPRGALRGEGLIVETGGKVDRCGACGEWGTVETDFREEMSIEELGIPPAPVYTSRT